MNKKEIAQQYTRQMLEQKPEVNTLEQDSMKVEDYSQIQNEQPTSDQPTKHPSELLQIRKLLPEIERMYSKALEVYRSKTEMYIALTTGKLKEADQVAELTVFKLKKTEEDFRNAYLLNSRIGSRWVIRVYLIAILSAICSALITMLMIWIIRL